MLESWQADATGRYPGQEGADPNVTGFLPLRRRRGQRGIHTAHRQTGARGALRDGRLQAPHVSLWIVGRGINTGLQTRIYFEDEDNSADPLLSRIEQRPRAATLIARRTAPGHYRFDIRLQGEGETVFLDL